MGLASTMNSRSLESQADSMVHGWRIGHLLRIHFVQIGNQNAMRQITQVSLCAAQVNLRTPPEAGHPSERSGGSCLPVTVCQILVISGSQSLPQRQPKRHRHGKARQDGASLQPSCIRFPLVCSFTLRSEAGTWDRNRKVGRLGL